MPPSSLDPSSRLATRVPADQWDPATRQSLIVEAWAQGMNVGAFVLITLLVLCNYRKGVLLHKLVLLEVWMRYES